VDFFKNHKNFQKKETIFKKSKKFPGLKKYIFSFFR